MREISIQDVQAQLREFAAERDWEQFHTPKNLATALTVECGELLEHFQWLTDQQSAELPEETKRDVAMELADVFLYLLRLADQVEVDLIDAAQQKIEINASRYPIGKARGNARKYDRL
jgi:dCTP diphosphatase